MKKRLQTVLAHAGVASRRHAAQLIESGKVKVDGLAITEKGFKVDPVGHEILVNGRPIPAEEKKYYFLFYKPKGIISTVSDTHGRKKVTDFFKNISARLYPVGRLDKDTTGILILTNDGELTHRLAHPRFEIEKEYRVKVAPCITGDDIRKIEHGIALEGKLTSGCEIKVERKNQKEAICRIKLHEGRKRQVRRMFEAVGVKVMELKRTGYAGLTLKGLKEGEFRELTKKEVERLRNPRT
jgi:23S rRNA pseudouridine2605 synthase